MARPVKSKEDRRPAVLSFRVTAAEQAALQERIAGSGLGPAEFIRRAVLNSRVVVNKAAATDPKLIAELNRIGVNLNQLTRTANGNGQVPPDLDRLCQKIEAVVMKAVEQEVV